MNMYKTGLLSAALVLSVSTSLVYAAQEQQQVYGWQLMTKQERAEYQEKMRNMKTMEERERFRMEHHEMMRKRAEERGMKLPDKPMHDMGSGPHDGMGMGMGKGKGGGADGK